MKEVLHVKQIMMLTVYKGPYTDYILTPRVQPKVVLFLVSNKNPYFSHFNPKTSASNSLYFGSNSRKCTHFQYTNFYFLQHFHNSLIPSVRCGK